MLVLLEIIAFSNKSRVIYGAKLRVSIRVLSHILGADVNVNVHLIKTIVLMCGLIKHVAYFRIKKYFALFCC